MIGMSLHSRSAPADLDAVDVGQHEVDDRRVRRAHRGAVERLLAGLGRDRLEAGLAQDDPQRSQDLRLVVADQDPPGAVHALAASGDRRQRQRDDEARPLPGQRLDRTRPPLASTKPFAIARPSPEPVSRAPAPR